MEKREHAFYDMMMSSISHERSLLSYPYQLNLQQVLNEVINERKKEF